MTGTAPVLHGRKIRRVAIAAASLTLLAGVALAQTTAAKRLPAVIPLPPPRPAAFGAAAAPATGAVTAPTIAAPTPPTASIVTTPPRGLPPLPVATREQMHACGAEWEKMKFSGAATDMTWRSFALDCLTRSAAH